MPIRDVRLQAEIVRAGRRRLLHCRLPDGQAFWVLPGGAREPGEPAAQGADGTAHLDAVAWLPLDDAVAWPADVRGDPFLVPQLRLVRARLAAAPAPSATPD